MRILFAADMSFNYLPGSPSEKQAFECMGQTAELFRTSDFSIVNLENILGNQADYTSITKSGPNLISDEACCAYVDVLKPTAVGLANNHAGDYGPAALLHTMDILSAKGYQLTGAGRTIDEAYRPAVFEQDGIKVAVYGVCENEFGIAKKSFAGSAGYQLTRVSHGIQQSKARGEIPVIYFHGGNECAPFPSPGKVELYRHFVELGAGAVIAMHTHCPQGYEMYRGCPIVYSMGNFFFPHRSDQKKSWNSGYMTMLDVTRDGITMEIVPYTFDSERHRLLQGEEKAQFERYMAALNEPIGNEELLQRYFDGLCMITGMYYIQALKYREEMVAEGAEASKVMKNALSCEAHNELVRNTMNMIFDGRCDSVCAEMETIQRLQRMEV